MKQSDRFKCERSVGLSKSSLGPADRLETFRLHCILLLRRSWRMRVEQAAPRPQSSNWVDFAPNACWECPGDGGGQPKWPLGYSNPSRTAVAMPASIPCKSKMRIRQGRSRSLGIGRPCSRRLRSPVFVSIACAWASGTDACQLNLLPRRAPGNEREDKILTCQPTIKGLSTI